MMVVMFSLVNTIHPKSNIVGYGLKIKVTGVLGLEDCPSPQIESCI